MMLILDIHLNKLKMQKRLFKLMNKKDIENLKIAVMGGLPASEKKYSINEFKEMISAYKDIITLI